MEFRFVLVEPARPGNVGAAARAMKTMGFERMVVVGSPGICEDPTARAFAHGSTDILDAAESAASLPAALERCDLAVATTGRRRGHRHDYVTPDRLREMLGEGTRGTTVAIVFGREESGLTNDEVEQCQITSLVPMRRAYPSLNLGQAVMVYSYALSSLVLHPAEKKPVATDAASVRVLTEKARRLLPRLGFDPGRALYQRMMERLGAADGTDVNLLHSLATAIDARLREQRSTERSPADEPEA